MNLKELEAKGATKNPYHWTPGYFYCVNCKQYRQILAMTLEGKTYELCSNCNEEL